MAQWRKTLDVKDIFNNEDTSFDEKKVEIARRVRRLQRELDADGVGYLPDWIEASEDVVEFDDWWSDFYDWCDANRVWVVTF
jgi:hypothetical protein